MLFHLFSCDNGSSRSEIEFEEAYYANNSIVMYQKGLKYIVTKARSIHLSEMGKFLLPKRVSSSFFILRPGLKSEIERLVISPGFQIHICAEK